MLDLSKDPRAKVLIATPHTGQVHVAFLQSILAIYAKTDPATAIIRWEGCAGSNICENQNVLAEMALDNDCTHMLSAESDHAFPGEALSLLLSHNKDIVGCTYAYKDHDLLARNLAIDRIAVRYGDKAAVAAQKRANLRYMGHELDQTPFSFRSLVEGEPVREVDFLPLGLLLISTKALRAVKAMRTQNATPRLPEGMTSMIFHHSEAAISGHKRTLSTTADSGFCYDARAAGFPTYLDARLSLMVEHIGAANYGMLPHTWAPPEMLQAANG